MDAFREAYGFVASDDVLRAISPMIVNTMGEVSRSEDFLGYASGTDFKPGLSPSNLAALSEKLRVRFDQSMEYFYPIKDRDQMAKRHDRLGIKLAGIRPLKIRSTDVKEIKAELISLKR